MSTRRDFITLLGGAAAWPLAGCAQQAASIPKAAFRGAVSGGAQVVLVLSSPFFLPQRTRVTELAKTHGLPSMFIAKHWAEAGGLIGLMVTTNGHRSYVVQYRSAGKSRRFTIKGLPALDAARKQARIILGKVAAGIPAPPLR